MPEKTRDLTPIWDFLAIFVTCVPITVLRWLGAKSRASIMTHKSLTNFKNSYHFFRAIPDTNFVFNMLLISSIIQCNRFPGVPRYSPKVMADLLKKTSFFGQKRAFHPLFRLFPAKIFSQANSMDLISLLR